MFPSTPFLRNRIAAILNYYRTREGRARLCERQRLAAQKTTRSDANKSPAPQASILEPIGRDCIFGLTIFHFDYKHYTSID